MQMVAGVVEGLSDEDDDEDPAVDDEEEQEAVEAVPVLLSLKVRLVFAVLVAVAQKGNDEKLGAGFAAGTKETRGAATRGFLFVVPSWSSSVLFVLRVLPRRFFFIIVGVVVGGGVRFLVGALCGALRSPLLLLRVHMFSCFLGEWQR